MEDMKARRRLASLARAWRWARLRLAAAACTRRRGGGVGELFLPCKQRPRAHLRVAEGLGGAT